MAVLLGQPFEYYYYFEYYAIFPHGQSELCIVMQNIEIHRCTCLYIYMLHKIDVPHQHKQLSLEYTVPYAKTLENVLLEQWTGHFLSHVTCYAQTRHIKMFRLS